MLIPRPPDALDDVPKYMTDSWRLGFHDGYRQIASVVGEETLIALTAEAWDHESRLKVATSRADRLQEERQAAKDELLPAYGTRKYSRAAVIMTWIYLFAGAVALVAEFLLWNTTVVEALHTQSDLAKFFGEYMVFALAAILSLVGLPLKLAYDVFTEMLAKDWKSWGLGAITVACLCLGLLSAWGGAHLREAVTTQLANINGKSEFTQEERHGRLVQGQDKIYHWSGVTFFWLSITLVVLSPTCLLVGVHQLKGYKRHKLALVDLERIDGELGEAVSSRSQLESNLATSLRNRGNEERNDLTRTEVDRRAIVMYRHGYETGTTQLMEERGKKLLYGQLIIKLNQGRTR